MDFEGLVIRKRVGRSSKSDRRAVCLETEDRTYILRRIGGHPFHDDVLDDLVGVSIKGEGRVSGQTLFLEEWEVTDEPEEE